MDKPTISDNRSHRTGTPPGALLQRLADSIEGGRWLAAVLSGSNPLSTLRSLWGVRWAWSSAGHLPRGGWAAFLCELEARERAVGRGTSVRLVPLAVRLLDSPNHTAAFVAAAYLKEWGHALGLPSVVAMLAARDPGHRAWVARYLGEYEDPSLVGHLLPLLDDPSERVRKEAVRAIARCGGCRAVEHLRPRLSDEHSPEVRAMLAACIGLLQAGSGSR